MRIRGNLVALLVASVVAAWGFGTVSAAARSAPHVYVVDASGSGDFSDIQTALDSVPPGSTLFVKGLWTITFPLFVQKEVTIVGMQLQTIYAYWTGDDDDEVLVIDAGAAATVSLKDVNIHCFTNYGPAYTAIDVRSVGDLVLRDSTITAGGALAQPCETYDHNGDAVVVHSARSVSVAGCTITGGGPGDTLWFSDNCPQYRHARGGHGVEVAGSAGLLLIEDSIITGGTGSDVGWDCERQGFAEVEPVGSDGGDAIRNALGTTFLSNATLNGGLPGHGWTMFCDPPSGQPGQPGMDLVGTGVDLPDALEAGDSIIGKVLTLEGRGFAPDRFALLFLAPSVGPPTAMRMGAWFLDWPFQLLAVVPTDPAGSFKLQGTLPHDAGLIGITLAFQATDLVLLSEPLLLVLRGGGG